MDNNQNPSGNPFHMDENDTDKNTGSGLGYDPETFGTTGSDQSGIYNNQTGTYDAGAYNNTTGSYDAGAYNNTTGSYDAGAYQGTGEQNVNVQTPQNMVDLGEKKAKTSLILGIILNVLNLIMMCSMLFGGGFLYGGLFVILSIVGIQNANQGRNSAKRGMATAGLVLNIVALVFAALFVILGLVLKFIAD